MLTYIIVFIICSFPPACETTTPNLRSAVVRVHGCSRSFFQQTFFWTVLEASWNVIAHAQKPDFVFRQNGRIHLSRGGRQFSRLLAAEVCASAVVMLDTSRSEIVWWVLATHPIRQFPLQFPSRASPCAITFQLDSNSLKRVRLASVPALRSICFCCPVPHCLTTWSDVDRKNSQAPPKHPAASVAACNCGRPLQPNPAWSFSSLCLSLGQESAVSAEFSTTVTGRLFQLHLAASYSKTLALIAIIKRRNINYREQCRCCCWLDGH